MKRFIFVFVIIALTIFGTINNSVDATNADNVSGYAWSSNTGWVNLNGSNYGLHILTSTPGTLSGYAWSSNLGWIGFEGAADWSNPINNKIPIKGFARVCSVYVNGCSGELKSEAERGGWDGLISLYDQTGADAWGWVINQDKTISGYAWGSDVVGWVELKNATISFNETIKLKLTATPDTILSGETSTLTLTANNIDGPAACTPSWGTITMAGGTGAWKGTHTVNPIDTTTYTVTCTFNGEKETTQAVVTVTKKDDVCPNIEGNQSTVPPGYGVNEYGSCVKDACPNNSDFPGFQSTVPAGYEQDSSGNCVVKDACTNIAGNQSTVPAGYTKDSSGQCVQNDSCNNIPGAQTTVPEGMIKDANGSCVQDTDPITPVPKPVDMCGNIPGIQLTVPEGWTQNANGNCVNQVSNDWCPNIIGMQTTTPQGMTIDPDGNCVLIDVCPNISGAQTTPPTGFTQDASGNCIPSCGSSCSNPTDPSTPLPGDGTGPGGSDGSGGQPGWDFCSNISGVQKTIPTGMTIDANGNCVSSGTLDTCPNISGTQASIPNGYAKDMYGNCISISGDYCPNLEGRQTFIPDGYSVDASGNCIPAKKRPIFIEF